MYLYDTNVISELTKRNRDKNVVNFVANVANSPNLAHISTITLGEIAKDIQQTGVKFINPFQTSYQLLP